MFVDQPLKPAHRTYYIDPRGVEIRCAAQSEPVAARMAELADHLDIREPGARSGETSPIVLQVMRDLDDCRVLRSLHEREREARRDVLIADLKSHLWTLRTAHHRVLLAGTKLMETSAGTRSWAFMMIVPSHIRSCTVIADLPGTAPAQARDTPWPPASALF